MEQEDKKPSHKNLFEIAHSFGRPPKYTDPAEMGKRIDSYIKYCDEIKGKPMKGTYTLEGCALFLGFASVQSLYDYEKRNDGHKDFAYVIHRFKLFMTDWNVQKLYWGGTYMGSQFWLRNHGGYTDETIQHQKQEVTNVTITEKKRDE